MERDWEKLRKWIIRRRLEGMRVSEICAQAKISRKVFYFWWNRYQAQGWIGLQEKQRGSPQGPELDNALKKKVVKLRKRYDWGPNKIAGCLNRKGVTIDHNQTYQVICDAGLNHPIGEPRKLQLNLRKRVAANNALSPKTICLVPTLYNVKIRSL